MMCKTLGRRQLWAGMLTMSMTLCSPSYSEASLWSSVKSAITVNEKDHGDLSRGSITYKESNAERIERAITPAWAVKIGQSMNSMIWIGTTYKEIPYAEQDFYKLRNDKIEAEVDKKRQEHIAKKKAEASKAGAEVSELLNDLLVPSEQKKAQDDSKFLDGFDEDEVRRSISKRMFVSQSRAVLIPAIYVQAQAGDLYCIELETGLTSWANRLSVMIKQQPYEDDKHIYVVQGVDCIVIDKKSGFVAEKIAFDRAVHPVVYAHRGLVYAASYDQRILCYKWGERFPEWSKALPGSVSKGLYGDENGLMVPMNHGELISYGYDGKEQWSFVSKSNSDERIFLEGLRNEQGKAIEKEKAEARKDGRPEDSAIMFRITKEIELLDQKLKELNHRVRGKYLAAPHFQDKDLVIGSTDFQLYRMNRFSGLPQWSYTCTSEVREAAFVRAPWVWQLDSNGVMHRIDYKEGKGAAVQQGVDKVLDAHNNGALFMAKGEIKLWSDEVQATITNFNPKSLVAASLAGGYLVIFDAIQGQLLAYATTHMRSVK